jgi:hypothetical protein
MRSWRVWLAVGAAVSCGLVGCGDAGDQQGGDQQDVTTTAAFSRQAQRHRRATFVAAWDDPCGSTRSLVCGTDSQTYLNECQVQWPNRVAHLGACPSFVCSGVACADGFSCRTFSTYGVVTDQCVSDTGVAPACSCASGSHCVQDPSGAVRCETDVAARPAPDPRDACATEKCPAGMHCAIITNYGVPSVTCNVDR